MSRPFQISYVMPITAADAADAGILEASWNCATKWGIWKAVIDEIPYGRPYVQPGVRLSCGQMSVSGTVTAVTADGALDWARNKRRFATGFLDEADENAGETFYPLNGATPKTHTMTFTYAALDPSKEWVFG